MNPNCELQAAMGLDRTRNERDFYAAVTGRPFAGEFGERQSARRRGSRFEKNLLAPPGYARLLRDALSQTVGATASSLSLRDLEHEEPGNAPGNRIRRVKLTRKILSDALTGGPIVDIVVKPVLVVNTGFAPGDIRYRYVEPDFIVWAPAKQMYVPGDLKSFVVRAGVVESAKLERVRLQLGADVIALRDEVQKIGTGLEANVAPCGYLVFATPFGLSPDEPRLEDLSGAVSAVLRAISAFRQHRAHILALAAGAPISTVVSDLRIAFQEKCVSTCLLAEHCRSQVSDTPAVLGDAARDLLGTISISDAYRLMSGTRAPSGPDEAHLAVSLRAAAGV
jgi:hypothetical protein